jgi:Domain of unknown function (DUF4157)
MVQYKTPSEPSWDGNDEPLWQPQRSDTFDSANPFNEERDDPNDPFAFLKRKKKAKKDDDSNLSNHTQPKTKLEESAADLFGIPQSQLEQQIGSAHSSKETKADEIAKAATSEPLNPEASDQTKPPAASSEPDHNIPGLPKRGGTALPKDKKAQFERKVGNLDDVQVHKTPKHAKALGAAAFTIGRHVYLGENTTDETLSHELGHFNPEDKKTRKGRRKAPDDSWVIKQAQLKKKQAAARAAEKERQRKALEAEYERVAQIEADRKAAEARQRSLNAKAHRAAALDKIEQKALLQKQQQREQKAAAAAGTVMPTTAQPLQAVVKQAMRKPTDLSALVAKAMKQKEEHRQAKLQKTAQNYPGILSVLKPPSYFSGAMALGAAVMNPALSTSLVAGSMAWSALSTDPKVSGRLLNGAETQGKHSFQGATQLAQAPQSAHQGKGKADPIVSFQQNLKRNAQTVLQQNRTRLDQSQQRFSDPDPKNANWKELRRQGTAVAALNYKTSTATLKLLEIYRKATADRASSPFPLLHTATSAEERRQMILTFYQHQLGKNWEKLAPQMVPWVNQFYVADALRDRMFVHEPALAVLTPGELQQASTTANNHHSYSSALPRGSIRPATALAKCRKGCKTIKMAP